MTTNTVSVDGGPAGKASASYTVSDPVPSLIQFSDFAQQSGQTGLLLPGGYEGNGATLQMKAMSSTKAASVPTAAGKTNPLYLIRTPAGLTGKTYENFILQGTAQGHLYGGFMVDHQTNAVIRNVKLLGAGPGNKNYPPGETFGFNDWDCVNSAYYDCEVDGRLLGAAVMAAGWGANTCKGVKLYRVNVHDCQYSMPTFWQTTDVYTEDIVSRANWQGINAERCDRVHHVRPVVDLRGAHDSAPMHFSINNDQLNSTSFVIDDPVCNGGVAGDGVCTVMISAGYTQGGTTQKQTIDGITLNFNGIKATWLKASQANFALAQANPKKYGVWFS